MNDPFFKMWNTHTAECGEPPTIVNEAGDKYYGYFQNRFTEQWVFVYDPKRKIGELRGGDIGWDKLVLIKDGRTDVTLGKAETAWLQACWIAATGVG
jgi:hypothetical protein